MFMFFLHMLAAGNPGWNSPFAQSSAIAFANAASQDPTATAAAFAAASARACLFNAFSYSSRLLVHADTTHPA